MGKKRSKRNTRKNSSGKTSQQRTKASSPSKKLPLLLIVVIGLFVGGYLLYNKYNQNPVQNMPDEASSPGTSGDFRALRGGETRATLRPSLFTGKVARAYAIARDEPELLDSIYCYCYCKKNLGHKSLLTCFVDTHAAQCDICLDQTIYAFSLFKKGNDYRQVREAVDKKFWRPFS